MPAGLVRFEGFDHLSSWRQKWVSANGGIAQESGGSKPSPFATEASGHYVDRNFGYLNTGFGRASIEHDFGDNVGVSKVIFGFHLRVGNPTGPFVGDSDVFQLRFKDNIGNYYKQFALAIRANRRLQLWRGGTASTSAFANTNFSGSMVAETDPGIVRETGWDFFQLEISSPTGVVLKKNGTVLINDSTIPTSSATAPSNKFTRAGYCWEAFGFNYFITDNFYLIDAGVGDSFLGEVRVSTNYTSSQILSADYFISNSVLLQPNILGGIYNSYPPYSSRLFERQDFPSNGQVFDDADSSYVELLANCTASARFRMASFYPVGPILALSITPTLKNRSNSFAAQFIGQLEKDSVTDLLPISLQPGLGYVTRQAIVLLDPETGNPFSDQDFADGRWKFGFEETAGSDATLRTTQLVIERLHRAGANVGYRNRIFGAM